MKLSPSYLIPFFNRAMNEEVGLAIPTNDQKYLRSLADRTRGEHKPKYDALVVFAPANGEVWLVKKQLDRLDANNP